MTRRLFGPLIAVATLLFAGAPVLIAWAPYESTMGLVQKIFYFHVASWVMMFLSAFVCGVASAVFLFKGRVAADRVAAAAAELAVIFGLIGLVTGPLWARKAWGVWWQWDARLTMALVLWMIFTAYLLLREYGGSGSEKLAAGVALFGLANVPFVYWSVNVWRTIHPTTNVVPTLVPGMAGALWWSLVAFLLLYTAAMMARVRLEGQRAALDQLYRDLDDWGGQPHNEG
ncbi:MAG: cytochrome c biogenesis protein CcsA [Vicinamibacterales bacterium]|jgi:heme exporter protein C|nr:cytochrome C assembly protein [Acidobacteriota bacterium]MDP7671598.1 cytochrome c biogenesis protein CcsA [Vicinamibacterales bacterium]